MTLSGSGTCWMQLVKPSALHRDRTRADLDTDRQLVLALVKAIEIVGEAASRVTAPTKQRLPEIPWDDIVGMRHRLIHAYYD